jgi:hypothetical protein
VTSEPKIRTNRANARASTGPKTLNGRHRSAQNALRHGLSLSLYSSPTWSEEIGTLARALGGPAANREIKELAHRVAEAQIDVCRVRNARHQLLANTLSDPYYDSRANTRRKGAHLRSLLRSNTPDIALTDLASLLDAPEGPRKLAMILSEEVMQLLAMERYERRALSRRKFAIRALDEARRRRINLAPRIPYRDRRSKKGDHHA